MITSIINFFNTKRLIEYRNASITMIYNRMVVRLRYVFFINIKLNEFYMFLYGIDFLRFQNE